MAGYSLEKLIQLGANLELLSDWKPGDNPATAADIAVALRYGIPVRDGIVVDAIYIIDQHHADELRRVYQNAQTAGEHPKIKATEEFIDKYLIPGWKQQGEELDQRIEEDHRRSVQEAEEKAKRDLDEPMKEELIAHWKSIGGIVP
ncbi:hypothetical protein [Mycolicibacter sinensis]